MKNSINYKGFDFEYNLYCTPAEKQTFDYEGNEEEFEISLITLNGIDASELLEDQIEDFEKEVIKDLKQQRDY